MDETPPTLIPSRKELHVLVVEDSDLLRGLICRYLSTRGFSVIAAHSISTAQAALARRDFDVVICDCDLPDGTVHRLLPALPARCRLISLSGWGSFHRDLTEERWVAHWVKPFDVETMVRMLDDLHAERAAEDNIAPEAAQLAELKRKDIPPEVPMILRESAMLLTRGEISLAHFEANLERLRVEELEPRGLRLTTIAEGRQPIRYVIENRDGVHFTIEAPGERKG